MQHNMRSIYGATKHVLYCVLAPVFFIQVFVIVTQCAVIYVYIHTNNTITVKQSMCSVEYSYLE